MSTVGIIGCGKLGLPVALAIESRGHKVMGFDTSPFPYSFIKERRIPYKEEGIPPLLATTNLTMTHSLAEIVSECEIVFIAVQTPHQAEFEGSTPLPPHRVDFDYSFVEGVLSDIARVCDKIAKRTTVVLVSTCLPGTYREIFSRVIHPSMDFLYSPQFVAMGTVLQDYLAPEFNLIGSEKRDAALQLESFYATINSAPSIHTDITTAEGIKVSYNTWITAKTVIANAWGELSDRLEMNFSDIKKAWDLSTKRLWSTRYTEAGMSDGGGCHPRDNIALSYVAQKSGMSFNIWESLIAAREAFEKWHAQELIDAADANQHEIIILGRAFKPETNIEVGSPARLLSSLIERAHTHAESLDDLPVATYFIGTRHEKYRDYQFPPGSVVLDPHGIIQDQRGVTVRRLGRQGPFQEREAESCGTSKEFALSSSK